MGNLKEENRHEDGLNSQEDRILGSLTLKYQHICQVSVPRLLQNIFESFAVQLEWHLQRKLLQHQVGKFNIKGWSNSIR